MQFNGTELTEKTIEATKEYYHNLMLGCIEEIESGEVFCNDKVKAINYYRKRALIYKGDIARPSFTFLQQAYYIQTGECIGFLGND